MLTKITKKRMCTCVTVFLSQDRSVCNGLVPHNESIYVGWSCKSLDTWDCTWFRRHLVQQLNSSTKSVTSDKNSNWISLHIYIKDFIFLSRCCVINFLGIQVGLYPFPLFPQNSRTLLVKKQQILFWKSSGSKHIAGLLTLFCLLAGFWKDPKV